MTQIVIPAPDDMHLHVRQGNRMVSAVRYAAMHFGRAIINYFVYVSKNKSLVNR